LVNPSDPEQAPPPEGQTVAISFHEKPLVSVNCRQSVPSITVALTCPDSNRIEAARSILIFTITPLIKLGHLTVTANPTHYITQTGYIHR
jgi:hypothetical protein